MRTSKWRAKSDRVRAVRALVERLGKKPQDVTSRDFIDGHLSTLFSENGSSVYGLLREAGYRFSPLERNKVPRYYWMDRRNQVRAVRGLVRKLGKPPGHITADDFRHARLWSLLRYHDRNPARVLRAAGYRIGIDDLKTKPHGYWKSRKNRVAAIRKLVRKLGKPLAEVAIDDFIGSGICGVLPYYNFSVRGALQDAFEKPPWELRMRLPPSYWSPRERRREAIRWLLEATGKDVDGLKMNDFISRGLGGLYGSYSYFDNAKKAGMTALLRKHADFRERIRADLG